MSLFQSESFFAKLTRKEQKEHCQKKKIGRVIYMPGPTMRAGSYIITSIKQALHQYAFAIMTINNDFQYKMEESVIIVYR